MNLHFVNQTLYLELFCKRDSLASFYMEALMLRDIKNSLFLDKFDIDYKDAVVGV